ncbi:MAG: beta strand repeat-containing protein [Pirellulales bacterium]
MIRKAASCALATGIVASLLATHASAIDYFDWKSGLVGNQVWQQDGNWVQPSYPNSGSRGARIAVAADLNLDVGATNVAVAELLLDGTAAGVDINIVGSGGKLVFQNDDNNVGIDPAPSAPDVEDILQSEGVNHGRVYVTSSGVAGSTNTISAPVQFSNNGFLEGVDVFGTKSLTISGPVTIVGASANDSLQIRSYLPVGTKLQLTGDMNLTDAGDGTTGRFLVLNNYYTSDHATPPRGLIEISGQISGAGGIIAGWTWDVDGVETGTDDTLYDPAPPPAGPLGSIILSGDNTFTEDVLQARGNLVVGHDHALGVDNTFRQAGQAGGSKEVGYNLISSSDDRKIANNVQIAQWMTVKGAAQIAGIEDIGDHSLEFTGSVAQTNTRGIVNLLPTGKTLTFSGPVYPNIKAENPPGNGRALTLDGDGKTVISGGVRDQLVTGTEDPTLENKTGFLRVRGTGVVVIDGRVFTNGVQTGYNDTDYGGYTFVEGSNLHFRGNQNDEGTYPGDDLPNGGIVSRGGAVGVDEGVSTNSVFLNKLNNSSSPLGPLTSPFFATWGNNESVLTNYSTGGLMLGTVGTNEYTQNLDFTTGDLARAANMSLAAQEGGSTYTGTITPSSTVAVNPNTYQLGGGSGTLTLPNANQLTGARNVLVTNGGTVKLANSNNYSGTTRVLRKYATSSTGIARADSADPDLDGRYDETSLETAVSSTLSVTTLSNGGVASSLGSSSSAASNLVLQGGALKYEGAATSTDRLFTVGTTGATLDASGSGAVSFTNTGALAIDQPARRTGLISTGVFGGGNATVFGQPSHTTASRRAFHTEDLTIGMRVYTSGGDFTPPAGGSPVRITSITNREVMRAGQPELLDSESDTDASTLPNAWPGYTSSGSIPTIQFGPAPARFLTLTGSNTGNNTLAPLIGNAPAADLDAAATTAEVAAAEAAAGYGTVGVVKQGPGTWVLTGNNTYSGATNVEAGTLLINGLQTGSSLTTVSSGARFGGTGQIGGALTMLEGSIYTATGVANSLDALNVLGNVDLNALANTLDVTGITSGTHTLMTYAGTLLGTFESTPGYSVDYGTGSNSQITITKIATALVGDYNNNGKVDAADYNIWRDHLGAAGSTLGANRDPANSGVVSQADYNSWKANFGMALGSGALGSAAVPEPATSVLVGWISLFFAGAMRRKR